MSYQQPNQGYYAQPPPQGQYMQGPPPPQQVSDRLAVYCALLVLVQQLLMQCRCNTSRDRRRRRRRRRRIVGAWLLASRRCVVVGCAVRRASAVWIASNAAVKGWCMRWWGIVICVEGAAHTLVMFPMCSHARYPRGYGFARREAWGWSLVGGLSSNRSHEISFHCKKRKVPELDGELAHCFPAPC